ncbi:uroporphyrinogen decarboxylase family protein [Hathewaya histolytica]|uniref:Uroporphyrinogen decarboxylase HemE n=1 Tax=Hathewaya histolytica TaxID=1498 RepID=A0A4U9QV58_HATHI|nr:uroporphyrinogen decarboxylase family protein [Hathewaya histolytica]VTQ81908.1 uroporphyrinogen decarboxylase HemE [Hathewaya histolytica]
MNIDKLTIDERMKKLIKGEKIDRVPVIPHMETYAAKICNMTSREYYLNPEKAFVAQMWARDLHQHDGGIGYGFPECHAWEFGGDVEIPQSPRLGYPKIIKRPVSSLEDIKNLRIPNLDDAPIHSRILKFNRLCYEHGFGVGISAGSPMNIAYALAGNLVFRWLIKEPNAIHELLRISTDYLINVAEYYVEEFGSEQIGAGISCPMECHAIMAPKTFEAFSLPYLKEIYEKFSKLGIRIGTVHLCGDHNKNLKYWKEEIPLAKRTLITMGYEMDMQYVGDYLGEDYIIGGNLRNTTLQKGTPEEVYEEAKGIIEKMKHRKGGFVLTPDCTLIAEAPTANLHAMIKAARDFGRYE